MKKLLLGLLILSGLKCFASTVVCYDSGTGLVTKYKKSAPTGQYQNISNCLINPSLPSEPDSKYWIYDNGLRGMTTTEKNTHYLASAKKDKKAEIDAKTHELLDLGFTFNGTTFSLSDEAKINWTNIALAKNVLNFPTKISTKDDGEYTLASVITADAFYQTAIGTVKARYDSGRTLKEQVDACTSISCVDGIVDNR